MLITIGIHVYTDERAHDDVSFACIIANRYSNRCRLQRVIPNTRSSSLTFPLGGPRPRPPNDHCAMAPGQSPCEG